MGLTVLGLGEGFGSFTESSLNTTARIAKDRIAANTIKKLFLLFLLDVLAIFFSPLNAIKVIIPY